MKIEKDKLPTMYVDKVKYTAQYDEYGIVKHKWIGVDVALNDSDDPEKAFQLAQEMTEHFHKKANPHLEGTTVADVPPGPPQEIQIEKKPEEDRIKYLENDMLKETVLRLPDGTGGLLSWQKLVNQYPALKPAFDLRKSQIEFETNLKSIENIGCK